MTIETEHPQYAMIRPDYTMMRDAFEGQRQVKEKAQEYLPAAPSWLDADSRMLTSEGRVAYSNYLTRAYFPDLVSEAVAGLVGIINAEPASIQLPERMEYLLENATWRGDSMETLLTLIHGEQLLLGRIGLLADIAPDRNEFFLVPYLAETIINWDDTNEELLGRRDLRLVVVNESGNRRQDEFSWREERRYRAIRYRPGSTTYETFQEVDGARGEVVQPSLQGAVAPELPFVFIGSNDLNPMPDRIPLMGLADLCFAIYRLEADHRQSMFNTSQDTLFTFGAKFNSEGAQGVGRTIGGGSHWQMNQGDDAKFVGVDSQGLPELREAKESDYDRASRKGSELLTSGGNRQESGDALRVRVAARTATLNTVSRTAAAGLEYILGIIAQWMGEDPDEVVIKPNTRFANDLSSTGRVVLELQQSRRMGSQLSQRTLHEVYGKLGLTDRSFEEERDLIDTEDRVEDLVVMEEMEAERAEEAAQSNFDREQQARADEQEQDDRTENN